MSSGERARPQLIVALAVLIGLAVWWATRDAGGTPTATPHELGEPAVDPAAPQVARGPERAAPASDPPAEAETDAPAREARPRDPGQVVLVLQVDGLAARPGALRLRLAADDSSHDDLAWRYEPGDGWRAEGDVRPGSYDVVIARSEGARAGDPGMFRVAAPDVVHVPSGHETVWDVDVERRADWRSDGDGNVSGVVLLDGRPATGLLVDCAHSDVIAEVDADGGFVIDDAPSGTQTLRVCSEPMGNGCFVFAERVLDVPRGGRVHAVFRVRGARLSARLPDVRDLRVLGAALALDGEGARGDDAIELRMVRDDRADLGVLPVGTWYLETFGAGRRSERRGYALAAGHPLDVQPAEAPPLEATVTVAGSVAAALARHGPVGVLLRGRSDLRTHSADGRFRFAEALPGQYDAFVVQAGRRVACGVVTVPEAGTTDLELRPAAR